MNERSPTKSRRLQFGLSTFFIVALVMALVLPGLTTHNDELRGLAIATLRLAIVIILVTAAIRSRGYGRTFCIGALVPFFIGSGDGGASWGSIAGQIIFAAAKAISRGPNFDYPLGGLLFQFIDLSACAVCGLFAMLVHRALEPLKRDHRPAGPEER